MNMLVFVSEMNEQVSVFSIDDVMKLTFFYQYHSLYRIARFDTIYAISRWNVFHMQDLLFQTEALSQTFQYITKMQINLERLSSTFFFGGKIKPSNMKLSRGVVILWSYNNVVVYLF